MQNTTGLNYHNILGYILKLESNNEGQSDKLKVSWLGGSVGWVENINNWLIQVKSLQIFIVSCFQIFCICKFFPNKKQGKFSHTGVIRHIEQGIDFLKISFRSILRNSHLQGRGLPTSILIKNIFIIEKTFSIPGSSPHQ